MKDMKNKLINSIQRIEKWVEDHDYKGYDPFDGLLSYLSPLTLENLFLDRLLMQLVRQSPVNLRPLLGVKPEDSTIGRGYMASGYLIMYKITNEEIYKEKARLCLEWLMKNRSPGYKNFCWGKHFNYASRGGRYGKLEPITIWTSLIGQAFLDGYEVIGKKEYLEVATSICDWIMELPRNKTDSGTSLGYTTKGISSIHNSNMHGAAMLARTASYMQNTAYFTVAKEAMEFSCSRQLPNGAWYYGETQNNHWIDNFHTGYNLDGLKWFVEYSNYRAFEDNLKSGFSYYKNTFFEENGRPKYYHNRTYPVDIQCAAQSIETLANFSDYDESSLPLALKVAKWTIDNMQDESGYFYYRQYPLMKAKAPMIHWAQGTMYKALTALFSKVSE
jgi:rhamnogalacturonyl hydrolase YesR